MKTIRSCIWRWTPLNWEVWWACQFLTWGTMYYLFVSSHATARGHPTGRGSNEWYGASTGKCIYLCHRLWCRVWYVRFMLSMGAYGKLLGRRAAVFFSRPTWWNLKETARDQDADILLALVFAAVVLALTIALFARCTKRWCWKKHKDRINQSIVCDIGLV